MTREQFQADHRHMVCGLLMDLVVRARHNDQLGLFLDMAYPKIDALLASVYDAAAEKAKTPPPPKKETQK
jgi:hypothetical protein